MRYYVSLGDESLLMWLSTNAIRLFTVFQNGQSSPSCLKYLTQCLHGLYYTYVHISAKCASTVNLW